jgi:hypothetical protein
MKVFLFIILLSPDGEYRFHESEWPTLTECSARAQALNKLGFPDFLATCLVEDQTQEMIE